MGRRLGDPDDPLLVSVRSGAKFSMPGMMETVLNIGLNDDSRAGAGPAGRRRAVRLGLLPAADPDVRQDRAAASTASTSRTRIDEAKTGQGHRRTTSTSTPTTCAALVEHVQGHRPRAHRPRLPAGPARAAGPRRSARSSTRGTPTARSSTAGRSASRPTSAPRSTSWSMVFGNLGTDSGTGVAFTRDPGYRRSRASTATTCRTPRARTSSPASATPCRCRTWSSSTSRRTTSCWRSWPRWRTTTATCATSSSPSSAASCGCCRPGSASAPPARRS